MKKATIGVILFLVIGCGAQKDPIEKYVKEDIVLEIGSKINIKNIVDVEKVDNEELKKSIEKATVEIDYKDNEKIDGEIGKDKIFATNNVLVKYDYKDKEYEKDIEVKIKDTKKPEVKVNNNYTTALLNQEKNEESFIKELNLKVTDNGSYSTKVENYNKIDFSKVGEHKLKLVIQDEAKNTVKKDVYLFVGKDSITYNYQVVRSDLKPGFINYNLTLPTYITSYYDIKPGKKEKGSKYYKGSFIQEITLKNNTSKIVLTIVSGLPTDWGPYPVDQYSINNKEIYLYNEKNNYSYKKTVNMYQGVIVGRKEKSWILLRTYSENSGYDEIKRVTDLIARSSYEY